MRCFIFIALLHVSSVALAGEAEHKMSGSIDFGGLQTTGNSESKTYDGKLELGYAYQAWQADFFFTGTQTSDADKLTADYYEAEFKTLYNFAWQIYGFALFNYREDVFSGVYNENTILAGVGYHFFPEDESYQLDVEVGQGNRSTNKITKTRIDHDPITHIAVLAEYKWSDSDVLKVKWQTEGGNDDSFIKKEISWKHNLFQHVEVSFNYEARTLTAPAFGKTGTDSKTSVRFGYGF